MLSFAVLESVAIFCTTIASCHRLLAAGVRNGSGDRVERFVLLECNLHVCLLPVRGSVSKRVCEKYGQAEKTIKCA